MFKQLENKEPCPHAPTQNNSQAYLITCLRTSDISADSQHKSVHLFMPPTTPNSLTFNSHPSLLYNVSLSLSLSAGDYQEVERAASSPGSDPCAGYRQCHSSGGSLGSRTEQGYQVRGHVIGDVNTCMMLPTIMLNKP